MSDLMVFQGTTTNVAGAAITLDTERITVAVALINLDKGMVAKIWEIQVEGDGIETIRLQYTKDDTAAPIVWEDFKVVRKGVATDQVRHEKITRPLIVEAWNDTTSIRAIQDIGTANLEVSINIEFDKVKKQ